MAKKYQYIVLLAIVLVGAWYGYSHRELFANLGKVSVLSLILLTFLASVTQWLIGYQFKYLMRIFGVDLDFREWFGLSACNTMFNYYLPARGGIAVRAFYLKKKHDFSYSHYTSLITGAYAISFVLSAGAGLGLTLLHGLVHGTFHRTLVVIFGSLLLLTVVGAALLSVLLRGRNRLGNERIIRILRSVKEGLALFRENRRSTACYALLHLLAILVTGIRLSVAFYAIGIDARPMQVLIISALVSFSMFLSLTPGNLGIREGVVSFAAYLFGISAARATLAAFVDRGMMVIVAFSFGLVFSRILLSDMSSWRKRATDTPR